MLGRDRRDLITDLEAEIDSEAYDALGVASLACAILWFKPLALVLGLALVPGGLALQVRIAQRSTRLLPDQSD